MLCLGLDPDSEYLSMSVGSSTDVLAIYSQKIKGNKRGGIESMLKALCHHIPAFVKSLHLEPIWPMRIIIEGQRIYPGSKARPNDMIKLSKIAGAAAGVFAMYLPDTKILIPEPREWKGSVPKAVHQARTYTKLGWGYTKCKDYSYPQHPTVGQGLTQSEWKHMGDSIGLHMWGASNIT